MPPVGTNFTPVWPNGPASAFNAFTPPNVSAGKNFRCFQPRSKARMISEGVTTPGNSGSSRRLRGSGNGFAQAGRDAELRARVHGLLDLVRRQQGARADGDLRDALADAPDGFRRAGGAERDFHDLQAAGQQRLGQRHGVVRLVNDRHADQPLGEKGFCVHNFVRQVTPKNSRVNENYWSAGLRYGAFRTFELRVEG